MSGNPVAITLELSEVFPGSKSDFDEFKRLLANLSRTDTLFWCARLNLLLSNVRNSDRVSKQAYAVHQFLGSEARQRVVSLMQQHGPDRVWTFYRPQLLELFRWACLLCQDKQGDGSTFNNASTIENFARAALISGELWTQTIRLRETLKLDAGLQSARENALGTVRKNFEATGVGPDPIKALGHGYAIFRDFLPAHLPNMDANFREVAGLSIDEFFAVGGLLVANYLDVTPKTDRDQTRTGIFHAEHAVEATNTVLKDVFSRYMKLESQSADEVKGKLPITETAPFDYNILRRHPILRAEDNRAIIVDPVCFSERLAAGPLFLLLEGGRTKPQELFGAFGNAFEDYANSIIRRMFEVPPGLLTPNPKGSDENGQPIELADAALRFGKSIFLFEHKGLWIREDSILSPEPKKYLDQLRGKYSAGEDGEYKGMGQLARTISNLASEKWRSNQLRIPNRAIIYPILLANDTMIGTPLHTSFLAGEFQKLLAPDSVAKDGLMTKGRWKIAPAIVMTIQDLEDLETSMRNFSFRQFIMDYDVACRDRIVSLHNFMGLDKRYKDQLSHSKFVVENSLRVTDLSAKLMRGEAIHSNLPL